ncbi:heme o synthase [Parvularcula dongshanensis]|uniref:Protoheme IX farnesyltransferase n=1 Tax=Parvularcula dongshanensis TaxID=1173995 RepID=A0A840I2X5_9PROT|nr:heme o synthase [Parvularcula dongshanensis]MBB4658538.1 protoheme IX farnesyltransferase [Parvularcula dongshanensis]
MNTSEPKSYSPAGPQTPLMSLSTPGDYFALLKPRVMSLVVFTALVGMVAAPGPVPSWPLALLSLLAIAVGAGASGALNMWWDADIDAVMSRTKNRPIPSGRVPRAEAAAFGGFLALLSVWVLALSGRGYLGAGLLAFTIFFYAVIYSMGLKRRTPQNIVIGGAAGALPPVVGWAAVTGDAPLAAWLLFAIIFVWTPPHFWALNLLKAGDYEAAGIPMMPNVRGAPHTRGLIWWYSVLLAPLAVLPVLTPAAGWLYGVIAAGAGAEFLRRAWAVRRREDEAGQNAACRSLFGYSIFYLFGLFAALLIEHWLGLHG